MDLYNSGVYTEKRKELNKFEQLQELEEANLNFIKNKMNLLTEEQTTFLELNNESFGVDLKNVLLKTWVMFF